jgi:uncharacterized repeat protein (TIGR03803 family)
MRSKGFLRVIPMFAIAALVLLTATSAWSAGYKVLYNFNSQSSNPSSGLITDAAGNAYGTTSAGGISGVGTVYELSPKTGYHQLYAFRKSGSGAAGGFLPQGNLVFDSKGNLYGTTVAGGVKNTQCVNGCGVVFELTPAANGQPWTETVLYSFCSQANCADGASPQAGVIFDSAGNLYGTTESGGDSNGCSGGCGTVFELSSMQSGWIESVLFSFPGGPHGAAPEGTLIFDAAGNIYGTTGGSGAGNGGTVFELSPSGNGWLESVLYSFDGFSGSTDGYDPLAGLIFDGAGNLYGTTSTGGTNLHYGTVFKLSPGLTGWTETIVYSFGGGNDGAKPECNLVFDLSGNLYGTTFAGGGSKGCLGNGCGTVFRLAPSEGGGWTESLFRFPINGDFGLQPSSSVLLDAAYNVYGTTTKGGYDKGLINDGVVFRVKQ